MIYLLCFVLNFTVLIFLVKSWIFLRREIYRLKVFFDLFYLVFIYKIVFNGLLVDVLRFFSDGKVNEDYGVSSLEIFEITLYESLSNFIFLGLFLILSIRKKSLGKSKSLHYEFFILSCFTLGSILTLLLPSVFETVLWFFKGSLTSMGAISSIVLLVHSITHKRKVFLWFSLINILLIFAINMVAGLRGSIVGVTILLVIYSYIELPSYVWKKVLLVSFVPLLLVLFIGNYLGNLKYQFAVNASTKEFQLNSIIDYYNFAIDFTSPDLLSEISGQDLATDLFDDIEFRYGAPSLFAVGFIRMYDRGFKAGLQTEKNSFFSFLPRKIIGEDKPVSGSVDGTESGMGMFATYNEITGQDTVMSDFYVAGHYYWQFGIIGVILFSIIASVYCFIMLTISSNFNIVGHALWLVTFKPFWLLPKLWLSEIVIMQSTIILPTLFLLFSLRLVYFLRISK